MDMIKERVSLMGRQDGVKEMTNFKLTDSQCMQQTMIFKSYGFRTLRYVQCLECGYRSRSIDCNLMLNLPLDWSQKSVLTPAECNRSLQYGPSERSLAKRLLNCLLCMEPKRKPQTAKVEAKKKRRQKARSKVADDGGRTASETQESQANMLETEESQARVKSGQSERTTEFWSDLTKKFTRRNTIHNLDVEAQDYFEYDLLGNPVALSDYLLFEPQPTKGVFLRPGGVALRSLFESFSQIEHLCFPDQLYECPQCNEAARVKNGGEMPRNWLKQVQYVKTPAITRTLLFDPPENLLINLQRYSMIRQIVKKIHTHVRFEKELFLDDLMVHRIHKDKLD